MIAAAYLTSAINRLEEYKSLADRTFAQLDEAAFHFQPNGESNSIAQIIQHLHGNMQSRFTNFLTEDGEKPWRQRDKEFEVRQVNKQELLNLWEEGWKTVFEALQSLQPHQLEQTITIRTQPLTVIDAINRQLAHYSSHVGQIVYIGKMLKGAAWQPLSIAKGVSDAFNEQLSRH